MAYATIEPFGAEVTHYLLAQIAAAIYNVNRDPRKTKPLNAEEFMPRYSRENARRDAEPQSVYEQLKAGLTAAGVIR